jgi:NAD-dependent deacetylase
VAKQKLVALTGAGISAESGIKTFRDSDGLWENYRIEEVATPEAWNKNPELVLNFYKLRYNQCMQAKPNAAHLALAHLQKQFEVQIITQNIDDLHERAGSKNVLHLHGEIIEAKSTSVLENYFMRLNGIDYIDIYSKSPKGYAMRPNIVWFGEAVPKMDDAIALAQSADIFVVIGTSLQVYPAAGLTRYALKASKKFMIDPNAAATFQQASFLHIQKNAVEGILDFMLAIQ